MVIEQTTESVDGAVRPSSDCGRIDHALTDAELAADVGTLGALGNATRYEALRILADADGDVCVCELEPALEVSQSAVSQALARLADADLVSRRKEGRWRYYATTPRAERLLDALDESRSQSTREATQQ